MYLKPNQQTPLINSNWSLKSRSPAFWSQIYVQILIMWFGAEHGQSCRQVCEFSYRASTFASHPCWLGRVFSRVANCSSSSSSFWCKVCVVCSYWASTFASPTLVGWVSLHISPTFNFFFHRHVWSRHDLFFPEGDPHLLHQPLPGPPASLPGQDDHRHSKVAHPLRPGTLLIRVWTKPTALVRKKKKNTFI